MRRLCYICGLVSLSLTVTLVGCTEGDQESSSEDIEDFEQSDSEGDLTGENGGEVSEPLEDTADNDSDLEDKETEEVHETETSTECTEPNPAGCSSDSDCPADHVCKDDPDNCDPSSCQCLEDGTWACTEDCGGTVCIEQQDEDTNQCPPKDPPLCDNDADCDPGEVCMDPTGSGEQNCHPSECGCMENGEWNCTRDCNGTVCIPEEQACPGEDPSGCTSDDECGEGEICEETDNCISSSCICDGGGWTCTSDCSGGVCVDSRN